MRMIPGLALDLTTVDPDGRTPLDFNYSEKAQKAKRIIQEKKALLLIGSPMCAAFSQLQNLNFAKMSKEDVDKVLEHGKRHFSILHRIVLDTDQSGIVFSA